MILTSPAALVIVTVHAFSAEMAMYGSALLPDPPGEHTMVELTQNSLPCVDAWPQAGAVIPMNRTTSSVILLSFFI